jgi:GNAT superfamily N-acetyltransferase
MLDGEEVWRFRGPANGGQADANRIAQLWLRDQRSQGLLSPAPGAEIEVVPVMIEGIQESLKEIAAMPAHQFAGGKDMLGMFQTPAKKHLKPLPGGTDLQYAIVKGTHFYGTIVQIVDPGMPGITRPQVVAVLNLDSSSLPNTVQVGSITVDEDYRGRGLARALYGIVLTIMQKNLVSGSSQTPGGRRNWMSLSAIPGVEVQGLVRIPNQIFDLERTATASPQWRKYADRTMDQIMELGGQFHSKDNNSTYWLFDVVPGKGSLQPAVKNALSRLYGYDSDNLLLATWTGA